MESEAIREQEIKVMLKAALKVSQLVPSLDKSDALYSVGMDPDEAESAVMKEKFRHLSVAHVQRHGQAALRRDLASMKERASTLMMLMKRDPNDRTKKSLKQTDAMKLVGFNTDQARTGTNEYQQIYRLIKSKKKQATEAMEAHRPGIVFQPPAPLVSPLSVSTTEESLFGGKSNGSHSSSSRMSSGSGTSASETTPSVSEAPTVIPDDFMENYYVWPTTYPDDDALPRDQDELISLPSQAKPKSLQSLTTTANFRNTTEAAHRENQLVAEGRAIRSCIYKAATVLWQSVHDEENTLKVFSKPEKVAAAFNSMCGIELISGNELATAVERGNAGKSPPRRGRHGTVPEDEFQAFCDALFTLSAIEQINGLQRLTRSELLSLVGSVLSARREEDEELEPIGAVNFFRRIEMENCRRQTSQRPDRREAIRVKWLTYQCQKKNYERWEETAVELGFARYPRDGEDSNGQFIIWHEGQEHRVLNFDEMSLDLDISSTQAGGRPSNVPAANGVAGEGEAAQKSSEKVTCIFGMTFAGDPLPPYFQFPTKATDPDRYKLQCKLLASFPQIKGKFGYPVERYFDVDFGMNPKGGMTKETLR